MKSIDGPNVGLSRRQLIEGAAALGVAMPGLQARADDATVAPHNVLLIITDEESRHLRPADGYTLDARGELERRGTVFENHYIGAAMCTPSRGVMFSGQPPQVNGVFDQMEAGYVPSLPRDTPSIGTVFKALGYATAYFGKFELKKSIVKVEDTVNYTDALTDYGFDHFSPDGDKVGAPDQGYRTDTYTAAEAIRWMRTHGQTLNAAGTPWLLVVSFVSPHDIMYADVNRTGSSEQQSAVGQTILAPPEDAGFDRRWTFAPSASAEQPMDAPGRPRAQLSYMVGWSAFLGEIPVKASDMWRDYYNFYLNLIADNDRTLGGVLDTLTALDLWSSTVVVRTAAHGELGGDHGGLRGKGPLPYEAESHVPLVVVHPDRPGGRRCQALTSHIDLLPGLVGLAGVPQAQAAPQLAGLPGKDFSILLDDPAGAQPTALRPAVLFNYVGLQTIDALYMMRVCRAIASGVPLPPFSQVRPDVSRRGFINFVYDGQHKYARYFSPLDLTRRPTSYEAVMEDFEIELFDLAADPDELLNLGIEAENRALVERMNALLNGMLEEEVGPVSPGFLPAGVLPG
mgnify:FL=1